MATIPSISDYGISARGYAEFIDDIPAAIFRTTLEGKIVYCNNAFADIFGFDSAAELIDSPVIELYRNKKDRGVFIDSILQRGRLFDLPIAFKMKDGTPIMCAVSAKAVLDDDEMVIHLDGFLREIIGHTVAEKDIEDIADRADLCSQNPPTEDHRENAGDHPGALSVVVSHDVPDRDGIGVPAHPGGDEPGDDSLIRTMTQNLGSGVIPAIEPPGGFHSVWPAFALANWNWPPVNFYSSQCESFA